MDRVPLESLVLDGVANIAVGEVDVIDSQNVTTHQLYIAGVPTGSVTVSAGTAVVGNNTTSIQSYEFEFSITDKTIADSLMRCSGREVELHYKEYLGSLPWRGQQKYIVDRILAVR